MCVCVCVCVCVCCVSYIIGSAVCPFVSEYGQDKAEILLRTGQGLVEESVVPLLITDCEDGRQRGQLGSNVRLGGVQVTSAPQDRAFTWLEQLWKTQRAAVKVKFGNKESKWVRPWPLIGGRARKFLISKETASKAQSSPQLMGLWAKNTLWVVCENKKKILTNLCATAQLNALTYINS